MEKNIKILTFFNFLLDFRLYSPIAVIYFSQVTGSFAQGMSVFSVLMITQVVLELPTGILSDFIGRKKTMILGSLFAGKLIQKYTATFTLFASSLAASVMNFVALLLSNVFSPAILMIPDILYGANRTAIETLQQEEFSDEQRATMGSLSGMLGSFLFAIAAVFFGWFADTYGVVLALLLGEIVLLSVPYLNYHIFKRSQ